MKLPFRPILTELELQDKETLASPLSPYETAFSHYRATAQQVREAGRKGDKEAYGKACRALENDRERIDRIVQNATRRF